MRKKPKDSTEFFRKLYGPVLQRTRADPNLVYVESGKRGGAARTRNLSPEERRESARKAGKARQAQISKEEKLIQMKLMEAARRRLPQSVRTRAARIAGKASWAKKTPEARERFRQRVIGLHASTTIEEKRKSIAIAQAARMEKVRLRREAKAQAEHERLKAERDALARAALFKNRK